MYIHSGTSITNRSVPPCRVIPVLAYEDVAQAVDWLCDTFCFTERLRIRDHRAQLLIMICRRGVIDHARLPLGHGKGR